MAANREHVAPEEREIPVFTVLKGNCILKNIFLLDSPPEISSSPCSSLPAKGNSDREFDAEEVLMVGRNPNCNIKLEHPSISRFHLRIHSNPSSRSLCVTDLSSVHGTWISGQRIEPGVIVKLNEGDTLRLGASSRLYKLNWVPISFAYDIDNPFVPKLGADDIAAEIKEGATDQTLIDNMEGLELLFSDEDLGLSIQERSPSALVMSQDFVDSPSIIEEALNASSSRICKLENGISSGKLSDLDKENSMPCVNSPLTMTQEVCQVLANSSLNIEEVANSTSPRICKLENGISSSKLCGFDQENSTTCAHSPLAMSQEVFQVLASSSSSIEVANATPPRLCKLENGISSGKLCGFDKENSTPCAHSPLVVSQKVYQDLVDSHSNIQEVANIDLSEVCKPESSILSGELCGFDKENHIPGAHSPLLVPQHVSQLGSSETFGMNSGKRSGLSIWSRRGKPENVHIETSLSRGTCSRTKSFSDVKNKSKAVQPCSNEEISTPDQENASPCFLLVTPIKSLGEDTLESQSVLKPPISNSNPDEEEIFTPDKENMTPNSLLLRSMKNIEKSEVKQPASYRPSPLKRANISNSYPEDTMLPALDKENHLRSALQQRKSTNSASKSHCSLKKQPAVLKARADRDPFRSLPVNSTDNRSTCSKVCELNMDSNGSISYPEEINQSHNLQNKTMKVDNNRWIIVVDTACLLYKHARKELQLLRGLRGTTLVIPRIVVRELDCMLRHGSFFRRTTDISAALQWIKESMAVAKWWIHVQSSAEEGSLVPPTPPASPCWFGEDKGSACSAGSSIPFSPYSLQEVVTPTATDHILECALLFKRTRNDGHVVLLTDDIALKIKAMAEGVMCETAEEFRRSLVNPFSKRFLYADSSPIGPSWSCADDVVLKEKYYPSPSKQQSKLGDSAKGLKLILLHNTSFRQITPSNFTQL